jgi:hypothetical protein
MIEDMSARKLNPHTQRSHIQSCKRFAAWLKRSPDTATPDEVRRFQLYLIRRFLLHVLPKGFHRIRHYGLLASANRAESIATARALLGADPPPVEAQKQPDITPDAPTVLRCPCPHCGARMIVIEVFARGCEPKWRPHPGRIDTS